MPSGINITSPAFDPGNLGTPDGIWDAALVHQRTLELPDAAVVVVSPHPDDEVLGAGGLIRAASLAGRDVTILSVTDGEAAYPDWEDLNQIRCREVTEALTKLVPHKVAHHHLRIPDGRVAQHRAALFAALDRYISRSALLVAPYERDGHPDHDATGEVCCEIARLRGARLWRYPIWTWHHSTPNQFADKSWGRLVLDAPAQRAKARAMSCFASQMRPSGREPIVPHHVVPYFARPYEAFLL
jgi:LmbE family N-acetylglucosaminyl deacetylase